jgi:hypothetical protein
VTLAELRAQILGPYEDGTRELWLLCPRCRAHRIFVRFWGLPAREQTDTTPRTWQARGAMTLSELSLTPSIDLSNAKPAQPCGGWHGHVANGNVAP